MLFCSIGSGIGTGPGVIEDCYNPNMDRHRINPRFNGHNALNAPSQSQFNMGGRPLIKPNQVNNFYSPLGLPHFFLCKCLYKKVIFAFCSRDRLCTKPRTRITQCCSSNSSSSSSLRMGDRNL